MLVQRANVVLDITPEEVETYVSRGFNVLSDDGMTVVREAIPTDVNTLQSSFKKHVAKIKELEAKVESLNKEIATLKAAKVSETKAKTTTKKKATTETSDVEEAA